MKERKKYIDVSKGLLILMVVWGHFELILRLCFNTTDDIITIFDRVENFWVAFFMPAFFFITGYCSNFNNHFGKFVYKSFRTILVPAIIITSVTTLNTYLHMDVNITWIVKTMIKSYIINGFSGEWFIASLFLSKIICWAIMRINDSKVRLLITFILFILGIVLYNTFTMIYEIWYFKHALIAVLFMMLGILMKDKVERYYHLWWIYLVLFVGSIVMIKCGALKSGIPYLTNRINLQYVDIPMYLLLSIAGINFILSISDKIKSSRVIEYLGRNSLVIFLLHFTFYQLYLTIAMPYFGRTVCVSILAFVFVYLCNVITCCGCAYLLNLKQFKWVLGK
jgi:fucose 4-O-acetylase-like acetyltransferase